jgi:hypothetical protein
VVHAANLGDAAARLDDLGELVQLLARMGGIDTVHVNGATGDRASGVDLTVKSECHCPPSPRYSVIVNVAVASSMIVAPQRGVSAEAAAGMASMASAMPVMMSFRIVSLCRGVVVLRLCWRHANRALTDR